VLNSIFCSVFVVAISVTITVNFLQYYSILSQQLNYLRIDLRFCWAYSWLWF